MKPIFALTILTSLFFSACSSEKPQKAVIDPAVYRVKNADELQQKINLLNQQLAQDYQNFKKKEYIAFSDQSALDTNDLKTLSLHAVSSTSLKPTKEAYCTMMNTYFNELYRLGYYNLNLLNDVKMNNAPQVDLKHKFENTDQFYTFILEEHSTYKHAQQLMGFGCNLRGALNP